MLPALILVAGIAFGQNSSLESAEKLLQENEFDSVLILLNDIDVNSLNDHQLARLYSTRGKAYLSLDRHDHSLNDYIQAKKYWSNLDSINQVGNSILQIVELLSHQENSEELAKPFLEEYIDHANKTGEPLDLANAYDRIARTFLDVDDIKNSIDYFEKAIEQAFIAGDTLKALGLKFNIGVVLNSNEAGRYSEALQIFQEVLPYFKKVNRQNYIAYNYNNQAKSYRGLKDYNNAILYYAKADSIPLSSNNIKTKRIFYKNMAETFKEAEDYKQATSYLNLFIKINDSLNQLNQDREIADAATKYKTLETESALAIEQEANTKNKAIAYGLGGTLGLGSIIAFLLYRNTKRKQRIAEQEKEIEIQKTEKILKEQELNTIDAMIAGQEKERQRLAGDLHDSVGATLSAAKMQFDHLKKNKGSLKNEDELFASTSELLEEAYKEVRSMAHAKNSGVIAKNGLLPAVQKLAKNASATKNLTIEVQDFGLEERLEGGMEIAIFRMIQELVTNIIKHAEASEASISITQHEQSLNVMVEDNGKGFKAVQLAHKEGMGLGSIEKRIEHLEGTFEVDSVPGKGTSISIDIPL